MKKNRRLSFGELLTSAHNRTEVIVSFLALLELVKQKAVALRQREIFSDIVIEKI